jgi:uncharacterized metal-binding protein YceD (DUF177 family)
MIPEMSRLVAVDRIPPAGMTEHVLATEAERKALAERFELVAINRLTGVLHLEPWRRGGVKVTGRVDAEIVQTCVVTLDPFEVTLTEEIVRYFAGQTAPGPAAAVHTVESLEEDAPELVTGGSIDIGEVLAEALGLAINPYPRKPGAIFGSSGDGDNDSDTGTSPFAALRSMKRKGGT